MSSWVTLPESAQAEGSDEHPSAILVPSSASSGLFSNSRAAYAAGKPPAPKRLTKAGTEIIEAFLKQNGNNYNLSYRHAMDLADRIKVQTGYEGMDADKVMAWISRHKYKQRSLSQGTCEATSDTLQVHQPPPQSALPCTPPLPSFTQIGTEPPLHPQELSLGQIKVLQSVVGQQEVTDQLITLCAEAFNVGRGLIDEWMLNEREHRAPLTPISPTVPLADVHASPVNSIVWEGGRAPAATVWPTQPMSPPQPLQDIPRPEGQMGILTPPAFPQPLLQLPSMGSLFSGSLTPIPVSPTPSIPSQDRMLRAIIEGVKEANQAPFHLANVSTRPKNAAEFKAFFSAFEPTLKQLAEALNE